MFKTIEPEGFTHAILAFGAPLLLFIGSYEQQPQTKINNMDSLKSASR